MAKIIKHHVETKSENQFNIGDLIKWYVSYSDGRVSKSLKHYGTVTKVHPVNLHVQDKKGNIWRVNKIEEARWVDEHEFQNSEDDRY
jgi:hypothetical protein